MKRVSTIFITICLAMILVACNAVQGNGNRVEREVEVSDFTSIQLDGIGTVNIEIGEVESATVTTDENIQEFILVEVRGDTLYLGLVENSSIMTSLGVTYDITMPEVESIEVNGAGDVILEDYETDSLEVEVTGAGDIELNDIELDDSLTITITGSGDATVSGSAAALDLEVNGAGDFEGFDFEVETAQVDVSGAGGAQVNVSESLNGEVNGAGDIEYRGNPSVDVEENGAGDVTDAN